MNFETSEKISSDFVAEKNEEWSKKRVVFRSYRCFLESEKLSEEKICKRAKIFVNVRHFKAVFIFMVQRFGYDFVLILGWFW